MSTVSFEVALEYLLTHHTDKPRKWVTARWKTYLSKLSSEEVIALYWLFKSTPYTCPNFPLQ